MEELNPREFEELTQRLSALENPDLKIPAPAWRIEGPISLARAQDAWRQAYYSDELINAVIASRETSSAVTQVPSQLGRSSGLKHLGYLAAASFIFITGWRGAIIAKDYQQFKLEPKTCIVGASFSSGYGGEFREVPTRWTFERADLKHRLSRDEYFCKK